MRLFSFLSEAKKSDTPPLRLRNTLSGELQVFEPLGGTVKMYNCGPTVYDRVHIGNLRQYILADTLRRTLKAFGYDLKQVINITDVGHLTGDNAGDADTGEDRMEKAAVTRGKRAQDIASEITQAFFTDLDALGIEREHIEFPKATEYIKEQIALVQTLEQKGYAYKISDGVYFDTSRFKNYGKLGGINFAVEQVRARVEKNKEKRNPFDFALWKFSKPGENRQQEWPSPWGLGFPGWHIECTAMIFKLLGKQIDIHTGGVDHIAIHHNNEIAQAEVLTGKQYVRYWLHGEFITIEGKRIGKSVGNVILLQNIADHGLSPRSLRYWFLTGHYRTPMNFTWSAIEGADQALMRLNRLFLELPQSKLPADPTFVRQYMEAIANDLDTPHALALLWNMVRSDLNPAVKRASLTFADTILGLGLAEPRIITKLQVIPLSELPAGVLQMVDEREQARRGKDFEVADTLRERIEQAGYVVKDSAEGPLVSKR